MINWLRKKLGIDRIDENIIENNSKTKNQLVEIQNSIKSLIPKEKIKNTELVNNFNLNSGITDLTFKLNNKVLLDKNWSLVTSQDKKANFLSQIAGTSSVASSVSYTANSLYTATANSSQLMQYANGSFSSITMNGSQFGKHAGFVSVNPAVFTPILAVQFASMLTGQYYFKGLTKQLTSVQKGINELISLHHNERLAKLRYINTKTSELNKREFFTTEDYVLIDKLKYDLSIIRYEYLLSAQQEVLNTFDNTNKTNEEETIEIISKDSNRTEKALISFKTNKKKISNFFSGIYEKTGIDNGIKKIKRKTENSNKRVQEIAKKVNESKFFFYSDIALKSEQLYQLLKLLELKVNLSDKKPDHNRIGKISELYNSIIQFNYEDSIYDEMQDLQILLKENLLSKIENHKSNSQITRSKIETVEINILEKFKNIDNSLNEKYLIFNDITEIKKGFETQHQILIDNRTETTRVYTKTIANKA